MEQKRSKERSTPVSEGMGGGAPDSRADIALQALQKPLVRQAVPLQPTENPHTGAGRHDLNEACTHGETTCEQAFVVWGKDPHWNSYWRTVAWGEPTMEQRKSGRSCYGLI